MNSKKKEVKELTEQDLCKMCGLCCDGTMFGFVRLADEDSSFKKSNGFNASIQGKKNILRQPCQYFRDNSCRIYSSGRPQACYLFICKLLARYQHKKISFAQALALIEQTVALARQLKIRISTDNKGHNRALPNLFRNYIATHLNPDQSVLLEYGVLQRRIKRDFDMESNSQDVSDNVRTDINPVNNP